MPRRHRLSYFLHQRCLIAVLCGLLVIVAANSQIASQGESSGKPAETKNKQPPASTTRTPPVPGPPPEVEKIKPQTYDPDCRKPKDHDEADLCAQRQSVETAKAALWLAQWQTFFALIGLLGVIGTLIYTARAAKGAVRAADVAERALTQLERPYLFLVIEEVEKMVHVAGGAMRHKV